jgi:osmotically-inducible protein OsmY
MSRDGLPRSSLSAPCWWAGVCRGARAALLAAALLLGFGARLTAEDPLAVDVRRTVLARQALQDDPELAPLNLGIRVLNGVAILWGPVPSAALASRAVARLQSLPELTGVRNDLFPDPWPDARYAGEMPTSPRLPGRPASRSEEDRRPGRASPTASVPTPDWTAAGPPPVPVIGAPIPIPRSASPAEVAGPPARVARNSAAVEEAIRALRHGQERFRRLHVSLEGGQVYLSGAVPAWRDLYELAEAISRISGVQGVTIRAIRTDPPSR